MSEIRSLDHADVPAVAGMFQRVFRDERTASPALADYMRQLYLHGPGCDPEIRPLVHVNDEGRITGFVGVNAQLFGSNGLAEEAAQWSFIEASLAQYRGKPIALFVHKPLFLDHPAESDSDDPSVSQSCLDRASRTRLIALCRTHGVRLISSGHKHQTRSFSLDGIYYLWGPSTACVNGAPAALHWGLREVGFIDYRFRPEGFDHRIVGADILFRHENYMRKLSEQA